MRRKRGEGIVREKRPGDLGDQGNGVEEKI